jgi:4-hydroxybenzoate polyprenyltransferase
MKAALIFLQLMRPRHWTKNLVVFAGLVFSANLLQGSMALKTLQAFLVFCLAAGAVYIFNDLRDAQSDRLHPEKKKRPLAAGLMAPQTAAAGAAGILAVALAWGFVLSKEFAWVVAGYVLLNAGYSWGLKRLVILDVFSLSTGFVLRAVAGAVVIGVEISPWLLVVTTLLSLFQGFAKRRHELVTMGDKAVSHRRSLEEYSPVLLDQFMGVLASSTIIAYSLYTFTSTTAREHHWLMLTVPLVIYGILRYLYLVYQRNLGGSPEQILLKDKPMLATVILWMLVTGWILHQG